MEWITLDTEKQIDAIKNSDKPSIIFKHSTRCSISMMAKRQFELNWDDLPNNISCYFLDLLNHKTLSSYISEAFQVPHESPQMLLIIDGNCILEQSHGDISVEEILEVL